MNCQYSRFCTCRKEHGASSATSLNSVSDLQRRNLEGENWVQPSPTWIPPIRRRGALRAQDCGKVLFFTNRAMGKRKNTCRGEEFLTFQTLGFGSYCSLRFRKYLRDFCLLGKQNAHCSVFNSSFVNEGSRFWMFSYLNYSAVIQHTNVILSRGSSSLVIDGTVSACLSVTVSCCVWHIPRNAVSTCRQIHLVIISRVHTPSRSVGFTSFSHLTVPDCFHADATNSGKLLKVFSYT